MGRAFVDPTDGDNLHAFKTPGLRSLTHRAPFMHDGSLPDLEVVIYHYVDGGIERPSRARDMHALNLSEVEVEELLAFLSTLTGDREVVSLPVLPN